MQYRKSFVSAKAISRTGADAGSILCGTIRSNVGLRIRIQERQPRGDWGPIVGAFEILDAGDNMHTEVLRGLIGQALEADRLLKLLREAHPMCVNIVNSNILAREEG